MPAYVHTRACVRAWVGALVATATGVQEDPPEHRDTAIKTFYGKNAPLQVLDYQQNQIFL